MYMEQTDKIPTLPVCTQSRDWIWDSEQGFCHIESGLQLHPGSGSFPTSPFHSIEKLPHMTYFLVWDHVKLAQITRSRCTHPAVRASSLSGKSICGGAQACWSRLYTGGLASGSRWQYKGNVKTRWILSEHSARTVWQQLPWFPDRWAFYIGYDPAGGDDCQERHDLQVRSFDIHSVSNSYVFGPFLI